MTRRGYIEEKMKQVTAFQINNFISFPILFDIKVWHRNLILGLETTTQEVNPFLGNLSRSFFTINLLYQ